MRITFSFFIALFLSLFLTSWAYAAPQVLTSVSDNSVIIGDIFTLSIEIDDSDSDYQLDTRPLEQDFTVLRPSKSQRTEYINGTLT
ncbi:MAG: BatD family protein, partial [Psychromonas sp.]